MTQGEKYLNCPHIKPFSIEGIRVHIDSKTGRIKHVYDGTTYEETGTVKLRLCDECFDDFKKTLEPGNELHQTMKRCPWLFHIEIPLAEEMKRWKHKSKRRKEKA